MTVKEKFEVIVLDQLCLEYDEINDFSTLEELGAEDSDYFDIIDSIKDEFNKDFDEYQLIDLTILEIVSILLDEDV